MNQKEEEEAKALELVDEFYKTERKTESSIILRSNAKRGALIFSSQ